MLIQEDFTLSEARSETDLCVCMVSNCSRHQSNSSSVETACDNAGSSEDAEHIRFESSRNESIGTDLMLMLSLWSNWVRQQHQVDWFVLPWRERRIREEKKRKGEKRLG